MKEYVITEEQFSIFRKITRILVSLQEDDARFQIDFCLVDRTSVEEAENTICSLEKVYEINNP